MIISCYMQKNLVLYQQFMLLIVENKHICCTLVVTIDKYLHKTLLRFVERLVYYILGRHKNCYFLLINSLSQIGYKAAYNRSLGKCPYITETPQREHHRQMKTLTSDVSTLFFLFICFVTWKKIDWLICLRWSMNLRSKLSFIRLILLWRLFWEAQVKGGFLCRLFWLYSDIIAVQKFNITIDDDLKAQVSLQ